MDKMSEPVAPANVNGDLLHVLRVAPHLITTLQASGITLQCIRLLCVEACSLASARVSALTLELDGTTEAHVPLHLVQSCELQHLRLGVSVREHCSPGLLQAQVSATQLAPHLTAVTRLTLQLRHHYPLGRRASTSRDKLNPTGALAAAVLQCFATICPLFCHLQVLNIHPEFCLDVLVTSLATDPLVLPRITTLTLRLPASQFPFHWKANEFAQLQAFSSLTSLDARGHRTPRAADWGVLSRSLRSLRLSETASEPLQLGISFARLLSLHLHSSVSCTSLALLLKCMPVLEKVSVQELAIYIRPGGPENDDARHFAELYANPILHLQRTSSPHNALISHLRFVSSTSTALMDVLSCMPMMPCITTCVCRIDVPENKPGSPAPRCFLPQIHRALPNLQALSLHQCDCPTNSFEELEHFTLLRKLEVSDSRAFTGAVAHKLITVLPLLGSLTVSYDLLGLHLGTGLQDYLNESLLPRLTAHNAWLLTSRDLM